MFESAGGDPFTWAGNLFGGWGGGGTPIVAGSVPSDAPYGAVLGAMNPAMAGYAGVPNEAFNATQPFVSGQTPNSPTDWKGISKAVGEAGKGISAKALPDSAGPQAAGGGSPIGKGGGPGLDQLVALLQKRREAWMQAAQSGQVPKQSTTSGLLGL